MSSTMKRKNPKYFDVRRKRMLTKNGNTYEEIINTQELSINLMCFILGDITYKELYGEDITGANHIFARMLSNIENLPDDLNADADGNEFPSNNDLKKSLKDSFTDICAIIATYNSTKTPQDPNLNLGELFWTKREDSATSPLAHARNGIVDELHSINVVSTRRHFCAPFVGVQKGFAPRVSPYSLEDFLFYFGDKSLEYFYSIPGTRSEKDAYRRAKEVGILNQKRDPSALAVLVHPEGNGMVCSGTGCVPSGDPDTWCVEVIVNGNRQCALGSDHQ